MVHEFKLNSLGNCFFCSDQIPRVDDPETSECPANSIQYLSRHLKMDMRKVFIDELLLSPELLVKVEKSRLKVELCGECASISEKFSGLYRQLEKVEMELGASLSEINQKMIRGSGVARGRPKHSQGTNGPGMEGYLKIVDALRAEAIQKCLQKLKNGEPRIKIQTLIAPPVRKEKAKIQNSSGVPQIKIEPESSLETASIIDDWLVPTLLDQDEFGDHFLVKNEPVVIEENLGTGTNNAAALISGENTYCAVSTANDDGNQNFGVNPKRSRRIHNRITKRKNESLLSSVAPKKALAASCRKTGRGRKSSHICQVCHRQFSYPKNLKEHMDRHHNANRQRLFKCDTCPKSFFTSRELQQHKLVHSAETPFKCSIYCNKAFKRTQSWKSHMRKHDPNRKRPFKCSICPKSFYTSDEMNRHMTVHKEERPFTCSICPMAFKTKRDVQLHMAIHFDVRPFPCQYCSKKFKRRSEQMLHERGHRGEHPHACGICGRRFLRQHRLRNHLKVHDDDDKKPYQCEGCKTRFSHKRSLLAHHKKGTCKYVSVPQSQTAVDTSGIEDIISIQSQ